MLFLAINTKAQTTIFEENFGQTTTRQFSDYVPDGLGYFIFADPNTLNNPNTSTNEIADAFHVDNNYYTIVAPAHLYTSMTRPPNSNYDFWFVPSDHTGNTNGAAMFVNAGTTLTTFYKRKSSVDLIPGNYYRISVYAYLQNNPPEIYLELMSPSGNTVVEKKSHFLVGSGWQSYELVVRIPAICTAADMKYYVSLVNNKSQYSGNDFATDDIKFEDLGASY